MIQSDYALYMRATFVLLTEGAESLMSRYVNLEPSRKRLKRTGKGI